MADNSSSAIQAKDINAVNNWALRLYRQMIKDDEGNLLFCPISLLLNLQQARLITEGKCQEEVNKVIKIEEDSMGLIIDQLGRLLEGGEASKANRPYDFFAGTKILLNNQHLALQANCLQDLKNLPAALTNKNSKDGAVIEYVERSEMKAIHSLINEVAKEVTLHRIDNITFKDPFSMDNDALLLLSIAHFHSHWEDKFLQRCSVNYEGRNRACVRALPATIEDFHNADGTIAKVLMLHLQAKIFLTRDEKLKVSILELPLNQYASSLLIVLPDADAGKKTLKHFEDNLKEETFEILRQNWQMPLTHCYLPKFSLQKDFSCSKYLQDLGLKDIFSPSKADLGNLSQSKRAKGASTPGLHVADILHSASIGISCESGEALAKSPVPAGQCSGALMPDTFATGFHVDRPFFFLIRPRTPEIWCMMGRVVHLADEVDLTVWNHHKDQQTAPDY